MNKMKIVTVTVNPVLDTSTITDIVVPLKKTRCKSPVHEPGGGGINVSRALKKLGCDSLAIIMAGGENGKKIRQLLNDEEINLKVVETEGNTRENIMVYEDKTGEHYRFVMPGPEMQKKEWQNLLETIKKLDPKPDYLVASGSLAPGVPDDFYARIAAHAKKNDIKMVIDSSGLPLKLAMEEGVYMAKPNLREMKELLDKPKLTGMELDHAARTILEKGYCTLLVVSLGEKGAMLARNDMIEYVVPPVMPVVSAVGAGDSMVAGMVVGCVRGFWPEKAIRYGVAAGTAATMTPGSELCRKSDTDEIYNWLSSDKGMDK
jgi:6-phosphofructokinase 2